MQQYIALLRGINVGGHRVKMTDLRALFEALGFANVATFIASGNVTFGADTGDTALLRAQIERHLEQALGYQVATFLRTPAELAAIVAYEPFPRAEIDADGRTLSIMFMAEPPPDELYRKLLAFQTPIDQLHVHSREIYWLTHGRTSDSQIDWALVGKSISIPLVTVRNATTVRKLAAKYPAPLDR
jgi:uncharacterized protein (DUF1697 family)